MVKSSYLSNVLKSIKYATIDTVAEMNPVIVEQYSSAKDFVQDTIDEIKEKASDKNPTASIKGTISKTYRNLKEDLASGNFYNNTFGALLAGGSGELILDLLGKSIQVQLCQQLLDGLGAHAGVELILIGLAHIHILLFGEERVFLQIGVARINDYIGGKVEYLFQQSGGHIEQKPHP